MNAPEERQESGKEEIVRRLERRPELKAGVPRLLDMVENTDGDLRRADEAERRAIEELRAPGRELPQSWGQGRGSDEVSSLSAQDGVARQVKKRHWRSAFGGIEVIEPIYRRKADGKLERPFATVAGVVCRGYSRPLQRAMMECRFGAQGRYRMDFHRLCGYLAGAASSCAPERTKRWVSAQKERLKSGELAAVIQKLTPV